MFKTRLIAFFILIIGFGIGFFVYQSEMSHMALSEGDQAHGVAKYPFKLGLDLSGGTHLVYRADVSKVKDAEVEDSMNALRDVIERRVNIFGVAEPVIQVQSGGFSNKGEERLIVDLPGVTDVSEAVEMIGKTPLLEFRTENPNKEQGEIVVDDDGKAVLQAPEPFIITELTGRYLSKAILNFDQMTGEPIISLEFNKEGSELFEKITSENVGKIVAIYLDGSPISTPVVNEAISGGQAQITGDFNPQEAKTLVGRLNSGALPVPIEHIGTNSIGPSLGDQATQAGVKAAIIGFLAIVLFLIFWYRLPGIIAVFSLLIYVSIVLAIFKLIPVVLTAAGIAGFIISIGIAVDANILIFERIKEELRNGRDVAEAIKNGFARAWYSIRDSNLSSMITAAILFWIGTPLIKGFALAFLIGVAMSLLAAIMITRLFLFALNFQKTSKIISFLFGSGFTSANIKK